MLQNFIKPFRTVYIILGSLALTGYTILASLFLVITGQSHRLLTNRLALFWSKGMLNIAAIRRTRSGPPNLFITPGRSYMIMCNHSSIYDIPLSFEAFEGQSLRMLTKKELSYIPLFGTALKQNEFIYVDRHNHEQAMEDLKAAKARMEDGIALWVAPEGTRSKTGELLPFKKGVFHLAIDTQAIVIPVIIKGAQNVLPTKSLNVASNRRVHVEVGQAIDTCDPEFSNKEALLSTVRQRMEALTAKDNPIIYS